MLFFSCFLFSTSVSAISLTENAKSAILIEESTGKVIYSYNEHEKLAPASMTKLMTLLIIMEEIDHGNIKYEDEVMVSSNAANMGGSQVFLEANSKITVEQLVKGIAIASGNDAAVAMAEYIGGSTEEFVNRMNDKASELKLTDTHFVNVHGLDTDNHYSSSYDMAMIARELLKHTKILNFTSLYEDYLYKPDGSKTWLVNTNKLVRFYDGVDGLKTGYTSNAGYCLTGTAKKNGMRFITVVMGEDSSEHRSLDTTNMLNYAFANYQVHSVIESNDVITVVPVKKGKINSVSLYVKNPILDLTKKNEVKEYTYQTDLKELVAPLKSGDVVGKLRVVSNSGEVVAEEDLIIKEDIPKNNFFHLFGSIFKSLVSGFY